MALRREDLTPHERAIQAGLDATWAGAQRVLADPEQCARLEAAIARLDDGYEAPRISGDEFLRVTAPVEE